MCAEPLFMMRASLAVGGLERLARERGMRAGAIDLGYATHMALGELFGDAAPAVFALRDSARRRRVQVLGYTHRDADALRAHAQAYAEPGPWQLCDWPGLATKPMPPEWPAGQRLGFRVRACPVRRGRDPDRKVFEVDAYTLACRDAQARGEDARDVDRRAVYHGWFADLVDRTDGVTLLDHRLSAMRRAQSWRRTQPRADAGHRDRRGRRVELPEAIFEGTLRIDDSAAFAARLSQGIGRHRAFGYGMLLLRPPC